jgi:enoyl-CoA hydratase
MDLVEVEPGPISTVVLNRPEARNALSIELCDEIVHKFEGLRDARVVVIKGAGSVFCAGADFAAVSGPDAARFLPSFERMLETVARHPAPTIASIHGAALGGGLQLATVCDFRVATESSKIGIPSTRLGIVVNFENVERLVLLVGVAVAKEVLMTGRMYSGADALAAGLVTESVTSEHLSAATNALAERIESLAPLSVRGAKKAIEIVADGLGGSRRSAPEAVGVVDRLVVDAYASEDLQEGLRAMGEKRAARFEGR